MTKGDHRFNPYLGLLPLALILAGVYLAEMAVPATQPDTLTVTNATWTKQPFHTYRVSGTTGQGEFTIESPDDSLAKVVKGDKIPVVVHSGRVFGTKRATLRE